MNYKFELDYLTLKLTNKCNMNCYMCGQAYACNQDNKEELPLFLIKKRLEEINTIKTIYLFGGEPFTYSKLPELLTYLKNKGLDILITTNGILLKEFAEQLIISKVRDLTISIDSYKEKVFENIRGKGVLPKILDNLNYMLEKKREYHSEYPHIGINCVILPENIDELYDYYKFFSENYPEIERINYEAPIATTFDMGKTYEKILRNELNTKADSWNWFFNRVSPYSDEDIKHLKIQINELKKFEKVTFLAPMNCKSIEGVFQSSYQIPEDICISPNHTLTILPNADAVFCADFPDYIVGNINHNTLEELLNNKKAEDFRKLLIHKGNLPICATCPRQYDEGDFLIKTKC